MSDDDEDAAGRLDREEEEGEVGAGDDDVVVGKAEAEEDELPSGTDDLVANTLLSLQLLLNRQRDEDEVKELTQTRSPLTKRNFSQ